MLQYIQARTPLPSKAQLHQAGDGMAVAGSAYMCLVSPTSARPADQKVLMHSRLIHAGS